MSEEITIKAAREHLKEFQRLLGGVEDEEKQSLELAIAVCKIRMQWKALNFGKEPLHAVTQMGLIAAEAKGKLIQDF